MEVLKAWFLDATILEINNLMGLFVVDYADTFEWVLVVNHRMA